LAILERRDSEDRGLPGALVADDNTQLSVRVRYLPVGVGLKEVRPQPLLGFVLGSIGPEELFEIHIRK